MHVNELKKILSWIDHDKYRNAARDYTLTDWAGAYYLRCHFFDIISIDECGDEGDRYALKIMKEKILNSLVSMSLLEETKRPSGWHPSWNNYYPVDSLRVYEVEGMSMDLPSREELESTDIRNEYFYQCEMKHISGESLSEAAGGSAFARIDLWAPDEVIMDAMRSWLENIRKVYQTAPVGRKYFTDVLLGRWRNARVLQYLDAKLFLSMKNIKISDALFEEALSINDNTKKMVSEFATREMACRLAAAGCFQKHG